MRNNMITVVAEDYVKMGRAKGSSPVASLAVRRTQRALAELTGFAMSLAS